MLSLKQYELSNHLGNVLATVLDRKTMTSDKVLAYATNFTGTLDGWTAGWSAAGTIYGATPPTTIALDNNRVKCTSTVSMGGVRKVINTTIGTAYTITMDIDLGTSEGLYIMPRATNGANEFTGTNITQVYVGASGTYTVNFTATTSTTQLLVEKAGYVEKYFFIDNVKVEQSTPTLNSYFIADVVNAQYYYPFGSTMKTWKADGDDYKFSFNGKEDDKEVEGQQDYGMRIYDKRLARFKSIDPLAYAYPMLTPYQFASNRPIDGIDLDGLEYATFTILVVDGKTTAISVTTDYELKNPNTKGPGVQYDFVYVNSVENTVQTKTDFKTNLHGIYQGGDNPKLPKIGASPNVLYDDYSLAPIDETDAIAKQHDKDYDKAGVAGVTGILSDKSTDANVKYIKDAKKIVEKYNKGEKDAYTGKPVSKETKDAAEFGMYWFKVAEDYKGKDEFGNEKEANPADLDTGPKY